MKKIFLKLLSLGIVAISLNSCALIFNGTTQSVSVTSQTEGSKIYVDGNKQGRGETLDLELDRKTNHTIQVKKDGCKTETIKLKKRVQPGWVVFDALLNWFAFLTDPTTGAWNTFDEDNIVVELECDAPLNK